METHAYDELYLWDAQNIMGHAFDFALVTLGLDIDDFSDKLIHSRSAGQFEVGNPAFVAGINGCEFVKKIYEEYDIEIEHPDEMYLNKSPEYWAGWALAFYQWFTALSFKDILAKVSIEKILDMYPIYHEMDIMQFKDAVDDML